MVEVAKLAQLDRLFTDVPPPEPFPSLLAEAGVELTLPQATHFAPSPAPSPGAAPVDRRGRVHGAPGMDKIAS